MLPTITVIGNLKRIETKFLDGGKQVTKFQIECADKDKNGKYTNLYLSGEVWEKSAEFVNNYFQEGSHAIVTGELFTNVYEKDGKKVYENKLRFPKVSFVPKDRAVQDQSNSHDNYSVNNSQQQPQVTHENVPAQQNFNQPPLYKAPQQSLPQMDIDPDGIPF